MLAGAHGAAASSLSTPAPPQFSSHALGLLPAEPLPPGNFSTHRERLAALPDQVDLTQWAMPPGDQGPVGSCATWAVGYTAMGYWENRDGITTPGGGSAMYIYSQTHVGGDGGSYYADDFAVAINQGVDNRDDYTQGDFDWVDRPTPLEISHAANWKLSGDKRLATNQADIESALANGHPVAIAIPVTPAFETNRSGVYPDPNNPVDDHTVLGGHGITALAYDQAGLKIENSWGPYWDDHGYVKIRWSWLATHLYEAYDVGDVVHTAPPTPPAPPVNNSGPTIGGTAELGNSLAEAHGDWTNSPTTYAYQWQRGDNSGANFTDIAGETAPAYQVGANDVGHTIRVEEWAGNAAGTSGPADSAATDLVPVPPTPPPDPPVNTGAPTIGGEAQPQSTLAESHGDWTNSPTDYSYQWQRGNGSGGDFTDIAGATSPDYVVASRDGGHTIRVEEWAENAGGNAGPAVSAATAVVPTPPTPPPPPPPPPPLMLTPPLISGTAQQGQLLSASPGVWAGNPVTYAYQWQDDGVYDIPGAMGPSYMAQSSDLGHRLNVVVTAINTGGFTTVASDSTAVVVGSSLGPHTAAAKPAITRRPAKRTTKRSVTFRFSDPTQGVTFQAKLDKRRWVSVKSQVTYRRLRLGKHTFSVRAVLNQQPGAVTRFTWKVVRRRR